MNFKAFKEIAKVHFQCVTVPALLSSDNGNTGNGVHVAVRVALLSRCSLHPWKGGRGTRFGAAIYRRRGATFHDKMAAGGIEISFFKTHPLACVEVTD